MLSRFVLLYNSVVVGYQTKLCHCTVCVCSCYQTLVKNIYPTSFVLLLSKAQYTPPTRRNCRVSSRRRCVHEFATSWRQFRRVIGVNTPVGSRDPYTAALCVRIAESVGSRREFMYTPPMRRDSTVSSRRRRRCVLGLRFPNGLRFIFSIWQICAEEDFASCCTLCH